MRASTQKPLLFFRGDAKTFLHTARAKKEAPKNIVLDFSGVRFVSRSFADELLNGIDELQSSAIKVTIRNPYPSVKQMLAHVRKTKKEIKKTMAQHREILSEGTGNPAPEQVRYGASRE